jgi:CHASE2 domain-containing sensor protein
MSRKVKYWLRDTLLCTLISMFVLFALSFLIVNISFFNPLKKVVKDFSFLDVYYAESLSLEDKINTDIVLINIEHRDRFELAQLLDQTLAADPKVVGVDIIFKDRKDAFVDSMLAKSFRNDKIISSYIVGNDSITRNHPIFDFNSEAGFVNLNFETETSVIREFVGVTEFEGEKHYSLAYHIAKRVMDPAKWESRNFERVLEGNTPIKYHGDYSMFLTLGYDEFMTSPDKEFLKDKIVILGYLGIPTGNVNDVEDKKFTPLNKVTSGKSIPDMYGAVVHANIINMILKNDLMYRVSNFWIGVMSFVFTFFIIMYFMWLEKRDKFYYRTIRKIILFLFTITMTGVALFLFKQGIILKVTPIIAIVLFCGSFIKYYKDIVDYIKTKTSWKSYIR